MYGAADFDDLPVEEYHPEKAKIIDIADIRAKLDAAIKARTKDMSRDEKLRFINETIMPALNGERNWKLCQDVILLTNLLAALEKSAA